MAEREFEIAAKGKVTEDDAEKIRQFLNAFPTINLSVDPIITWSEVNKSQEWEKELADFEERMERARVLTENGANQKGFRDLHAELMKDIQPQDSRYISYYQNFPDAVINIFQTTLQTYKQLFSHPKTPYTKTDTKKYPYIKGVLSVRSVRIIMDRFGIDKEDGSQKSYKEIANNENMNATSVLQNLKYSGMIDLRKALRRNARITLGSSPSTLKPPL